MNQQTVKLQHSYYLLALFIACFASVGCAIVIADILPVFKVFGVLIILLSCYHTVIRHAYRIAANAIVEINLHQGWVKCKSGKLHYGRWLINQGYYSGFLMILPFKSRHKTYSVLIPKDALSRYQYKQLFIYSTYQ